MVQIWRLLDVDGYTMKSINSLKMFETTATWLVYPKPPPWLAEMPPDLRKSMVLQAPEARKST